MSSDFVRRVPNELQLAIFSCLNQADLIHCSQTCSRWNFIANDQELWQKIADKIFTSGTLQAPFIKGFLRQFAHQKLHSNDQLVLRVQEFLDKIRAGQRAKFICFLGEGSQYQTISVEILPKYIITRETGPLRRFSDWDINNLEFDLEEHYFSLQPISDDGVLSTSIMSNYRHRNQRSAYFARQGDEMVYFSYRKSHNACLRIPYDLESSALQIRIDSLIHQRLDQLEGPLFKWKCILSEKMTNLGTSIRRCVICLFRTISYDANR